MKASIMGSSSIIIDGRENQGLTQIIKTMKEVHEKILEMPSAFPKVFVVYDSKTQKES